MSWFFGEDFQKIYMNMPMLQTMDKISPCFHREYIQDGYRKNYTFSHALLSLFTLHNETMNIWSHLIAFICALIGGFVVALEFQSEAVDITERVLIGVYVASAAMCMLLSTLYHWFSCMSEDHYYSLLSLDLTGIACLIAGSYFPGTYYAFMCTPFLQKLYLLTSTLILVVGIIIAKYGAANSHSAHLVRNGGFSALVVFGLVPITHWLMIAPEIYRNRLIPGTFGMFFFYGSGFLFLLTKFPENAYPKSYISTHIVSSHTLWHIAVAAAACVWFFTILDYQTMMQDTGCAPFSDQHLWYAV